MNENIQLVNDNNLKDNFQLVTNSNRLLEGTWEFFAFLGALILCAALVYFLRSRKEKISPGDDFEIIE